MIKFIWYYCRKSFLFLYFFLLNFILSSCMQPSQKRTLSFFRVPFWQPHTISRTQSHINDITSPNCQKPFHLVCEKFCHHPILFFPPKFAVKTSWFPRFLRRRRRGPCPRCKVVSRPEFGVGVRVVNVLFVLPQNRCCWPRRNKSEIFQVIRAREREWRRWPRKSAVWCWLIDGTGRNAEHRGKAKMTLDAAVLPSELVTTAQPLVGLSGLDVQRNTTHKTIWDAFNNSKKPERWVD